MWHWLAFWDWNWLLVAKIMGPVWVLGWFPASLALATYRFKTFDSAERCHVDYVSFVQGERALANRRYDNQASCQNYHSVKCWRADPLSDSRKQLFVHQSMGLALIWPLVILAGIAFVCGGSIAWLGVIAGRGVSNGTIYLTDHTVESITKFAESKADLSLPALEAKKKSKK